MPIRMVDDDPRESGGDDDSPRPGGGGSGGGGGGAALLGLLFFVFKYPKIGTPLLLIVGAIYVCSGPSKDGPDQPEGPSASSETMPGKKSDDGTFGTGAVLDPKVYDTALVHEPLAMTRAFGWGLAGWAAELAIAWATLAAVGIEPTIPLASLVVVATAAANAVAVSPGNAGPFELAATLPLAGLGIAPAPALAFALLLHLVHLVPAAALGAWVLVREASGRDR